MNTDKAYLLGLFVGGGIFGNDNSFRIKLPYKKWGSYESDPKRAGQIAETILKSLNNLFRATYGISVSYTASKSGEWNILCEGDLTKLQADLTNYGIACEGELRKTATIDKIFPDLIDDNMKRRFVAGLADTIGSTKKSHRRFTQDKQIISFEIPNGSDFNAVCSLCKLLHSIKCYPDQVLWNHPNMHCSSDPYYTKWTKGFKIRVLADQYANFGAFSFTAKAQSLLQNQQLEKEKNKALTCETKLNDLPTPKCIHPAENSDLLPPIIRGGHYLHNRHYCAVLGCEHAPYSFIQNTIDNAGNLINPFTILTKGTKGEIQDYIKNTPILSARKFTEQTLSITDILNSNSQLLFSRDNLVGYTTNEILEAINFLVSAKLKGKRTSGNRNDNIQAYLSQKPNATISVFVPDLPTVIILTLGERSAMVGANNPVAYSKLIKRTPNNQYKITVKPITEADLK